jgi:hypothetical protein
MKKRYLFIVGVVLLAVVGMTIAQPRPQPVSQPSLPPTPQPPAVQDPLVGHTPPRQPAEAKPESMTIEQLIDAVDGFREQRAELEKKERAYLKVLHKKADKLKERIDGLDEVERSLPPGVNPAPSCRPAPGLLNYTN